MRRFEHPSGKFWAIHNNEGRITVRWGPTGTAGQSIGREMPSFEAAELRVRTDIERQLKLGYVEVVAAPPAPPPPLDEWKIRVETPTQFIEIERVGTTVTDSRGKTPNGAPTKQVFAHATLAEAEAKISRLLAQATRLGYRTPDFVREIDPPDDDGDDDDDDEELEEDPDDDDDIELASWPTLVAECRAAPDDPGPWTVYADWLQDQNDPRGQLAALSLATPTSAQVKELTRKYRLALFGDDAIGRATKIVRWRHGFPAAIALETSESSGELLEWLKRLVTRPFLQFVEEFHFGLTDFEGDNDWGPAITLLAESELAPFVTGLHFDHYDRDQQELSWVAFGDFSAAWQRFPALRELVIKSGQGGQLGSIRLPELRTFVRISGGLGLAEIQAISTAHWPKLEHLEVWFGSSDYGANATVENLADIIAGTQTPALQHLGIVNCELVEDLLPRLSMSPLVARLRSLDLSRGMLSSATQLVKLAPRFAHLEVLDLGSNLLSADDVQLIRTALPNAVVDNQRDEDQHYVDVGE